MNIDLKTGQRSKGGEIAGIIGEMQNVTSKDEEEEEDMLSLMDKAQL